MGNDEQSNRGQPMSRLVVIAIWVGVIWFLGAGIISFLNTRTDRGGLDRPKARTEVAEIMTAAEAYQADYQHWPCEISDTNGDVTFGISSNEIQDFRTIPGTRLVASNTDIIIVLMDLDMGVNTGHRLNPRQTKYLNAKISGEKGSGVWTNDFQYRDPWGNPYVISLDVNGDRMVRDACYAGMTNSDGQAGMTKMEEVTVWSRGKDGKVSVAAPTDGGVNKDNVVSW